jgi:integrase
MTRAIISSGIKAGFKAAGIEMGGRTLHCFRHTYFSLLAESAGAEAASRAGGHSSVKITEENYIHETAEGRAKISACIDHLFEAEA